MLTSRLAVAVPLLLVLAAAVAGAAWLLLPRGTLSPTEIVRAAACGQGVPSAVDAVVSVADVSTAEESYDLTQPDARHNVRIDGDSIESQVSIAAQGENPGGSFTTILKGDYRYEGDDGQWQVYYRPGLTGPSTCGSADQASGAARAEPSATSTVLHALGGQAEGEYEYRGETTLNGVRAKHYVRVGPGPASGAGNAGTRNVAGPTATPTPIPLFGAYLQRIYDAVWMNGDGHFVRVEGRIPRSGVYRHLKFRVDYSGHGESNAITAPFALPVISAREAFIRRIVNVQLPAALNASGAVTVFALARAAVRADVQRLDPDDHGNSCRNDEANRVHANCGKQRPHSNANVLPGHSGISSCRHPLRRRII